MFSNDKVKKLLLEIEFGFNEIDKNSSEHAIDKVAELDEKDNKLSGDLTRFENSFFKKFKDKKHGTSFD